MKLSEDNYDNIAKCEDEKDLGVIFDKLLNIFHLMLIFKILLTRLTV